MNKSPTISELRARVFKHSGTSRPEIGNWLARRVGRPSAILGTWLLVRTRISADAITLSALITNILACFAIGTGSRIGFVLGAIALLMGYWLDHVDGQVARWRGTTTLSGVYFDYLLHHVSMLALGFALGFGLAVRGGAVLWTLAGFLMALGWLFLSLHNDCRYKALFTRLKRDSRSFRVDLPQSDRPAPPPPWPRRWPGIVTFPMAKLTEPHGVLSIVWALAILAAVLPSWWLMLWSFYVVLMMVIAPTLAIGRAGKSILRREPDREFDRIFRPM